MDTRRKKLMTHPEPASTPTTMTRRTLARGIAWAAPTALAAVAAPAIAASDACTPTATSAISPAFTATNIGAAGGAGVQWVRTTSPSGGFASGTGITYAASYSLLAGTITNAALLTADPAVKTPVSTQLSRSVCLARGTYTFAFRALGSRINLRDCYFTASLVRTRDGKVLGSASFDTDFGLVSRLLSLSFSATTTDRSTQAELRFQWAFKDSAFTAANDIGIEAPTVTFTAS